MTRRLDTEVKAEEARELWTATRILMGLRYPPDMVGQLLKGVHGVKESATYQEIRNEGFEEGVEKGMDKGRAVEARSFLLQGGEKLLGPADAVVRARLDAIADLSQLERLMYRMLYRTATTWEELLGS